MDQKPTNPLRAWYDKATTAERQRLAELAGTTTGTLEQVKGAYRTGGVVSASPELACRLEEASILLQREGLSPVVREDLCLACGACALAKVARSVI